MKNTSSIFAVAAGLLLPGAGLSAQAFGDLVDNGDGTFTNWIGTVSAVDDNPITFPGWVNHEEHGELFLFVNGEGVWIWDPNFPVDDDAEKFIYVDRNTFPWFYVDTSETWVRFVSGVEAAGDASRIFLPIGADPILLSKRQYRNIAELATSAGLSTLVTAVGAADAAIPAALTGDGPLTVFAPTNDAFADLGDTLSTVLLPENQGLLTDILLYHVVAGDFSAEDLTLDSANNFNGESNMFFVETLLGADIKVEVSSSGVSINGGAAVAMPNVQASNGMVHVIDSVLLPPGDLATVATEQGFSELVAAVGNANPAVLAALTGDTPLTVFAPTNEAFTAFLATLPPEGVSQEVLTEVLLYHVVPGKVYSPEVPVGTPITTADTAGNTLTVTVNDEGELMVNDAKILLTDVMAGNGVIHVIDKVITAPVQ